MKRLDYQKENVKFFETFIEILMNSLKKNDVKIVNFGIFKIKKKKKE